MKVQVIDNRIVAGPGEIFGTPAQGIYKLVGEMPETGEPTFEIIGEELHITGIKQTLQSIMDSDSYTDYKQRRKAISDYVQQVGFVNLSDSDKRIAAESFCSTPDKIASVLTFEEQLKAASVFDAGSMASRAARWKAAKTLLYNILSDADGQAVMSIILQRQFENLYTSLGQEGTMSVNYKGVADSPGVFDFILSTPGTEWETTGFASLGLVPLRGWTVQQVIDRLMDILQHGNY